MKRDEEQRWAFCDAQEVWLSDMPHKDGPFDGPS